MSRPASPRRSDTPTPGTYLLRLVRGGPYVGAAIVQRDDGWSVMIDGEWLGPSPDPWPADNPQFLAAMESVNFHGRPASEEEVKYRIGLKRWATIYDQSHAAANPRKAIDLDNIVPI